MAFTFWLEQILFGKVGFRTLVVEVDKQTSKNKSCSNQKNKCHFVIPILKVSVTKVQGFFDLTNFKFGHY